MRRMRIAVVVLLAAGAGPISNAHARPQEPNALTETLKGEVPDGRPSADIAETAGPIAVEEQVTDEQVQAKLLELLPKYPGVVTVHAEVSNGVADLTGHVVDEETRDRLLEFVRRVEGVHLVLNHTRTDAEVLTARQRAAKAIGEYRSIIASTWLIALIAVGILVGSILLARLFNAYSETLLAPFTGNVLMRSVMGSIIGLGIVVGGLFLALQVLRLTEVVLSVLGLAGVVALAVGFAFRDIAENFIASVLLGVRRPFQVGDYIEVAGQGGVVRSLNTRATVLVTLEGNQVRIPNATIFKEILINKSASESVRGTFDVVIPYGASTTKAQEVIGEALHHHEGISSTPPPRALVEGLEGDGVRLRCYFWMPSSGVDGFKVNSDARLEAKLALQRLGVTPSPKVLVVSGRLPAGPDGPLGATGNDAAVSSAREARANLRQDTRSAKESATHPESGVDVVEHVMKASSDGVSGEGADLLHSARSE